MVNVRVIIKPDAEGACTVPTCPVEPFGAIIFLNIAYEYVVLPVCGEHSQMIQGAQSGVVEVLRFRDKTFEEAVEGMTKEEIKEYKASLEADK